MTYWKLQLLSHKGNKQIFLATWHSFSGVLLHYNKTDDIIKFINVTNNKNDNHLKPTKHIYDEAYLPLK